MEEAYKPEVIIEEIEVNKNTDLNALGIFDDEMPIKVVEFGEIHEQEQDESETESDNEEIGCSANLDTENESIIKKKEKELTDKFLSGELNFSQYAALMDCQEDEDVAGNQYGVSSSSAADAFEVELQESINEKSKKFKGKSSKRRISRRTNLPPALKGLMGEANLRYARGERDVAIKMCLEIIREVPTAPEPFHTLAVLYEELGCPDKSLQFALIAAHLSRNDADNWIRLAGMSEEQGNLKQAVTCYSKAIAADVNNIDIYIKRGNLLEELGDKKGAMKSYLRLLNILTPEQGHVIRAVAKLVAQKFHEEGELTKAREAMETAFVKCPQQVSSEEVNLMLELLLQLRDYSECLNILVQYCNIEVEAISETVKDNEQTFNILSCNIPDNLPVDLLVKLMVVLIHLKSFHLIDSLLNLLLTQQDPEQSGDLYLDVAEALMAEQKYSDALKLLTPLVQSRNFSLAAVWLKQAECLKECDFLQEAVEAYKVVIEQAPQHLEARLILSNLLTKLNRAEEALEFLTQDENAEILQPGLLFERCMLLKEVSGRTDEFLAVGQLLLSRHCVRIRNQDELDALARLRRYSKKNEALKEIRASRGESNIDHDAPEFHSGMKEPSVEEEWQLFLDLCKTCIETKRFYLFERFAFSALGSKRFHSFPLGSNNLDFITLLACLYNGDTFFGYTFARDLVLKEMTKPRIWNVFNLILQHADDVRHNRFTMRLLARRPNNEPLALLHANNCLVAGTYKYALSEYTTAYRQNKKAVYPLLIGITLFQMACQKFSAKKHSLVVQALAFLEQYKDLRGEMGLQEYYYNLGRAFHQLGILPIAISNYEKVLEFDSSLITEHPMLDLRQEAAFNLHLIYLNSGAADLALMYLNKYITV